MRHDHGAVISIAATTRWYATDVSMKCQRSTILNETVGRMTMARPLELETARSAALAAGALLRDQFERPVGILRTSAHDVVLEIDAIAEAIVLRRLTATFPDDAIVAEETGARGTAPRTWLVDPLDGTINFASRIPFFAVSIALVVRGRAVLGVVHDPTADETYEAARGQGAWLRIGDGEPTRLRARRTVDLANAVLGLDPGDPDEPGVPLITALTRSIRTGRTFGSAALSLAWLAAGRLDGFVRPAGIQPLDIAAGALLAAEAGVRVTDGDGGRWPDLATPGLTIGVIAARPRLHQAILDRLR